MTATWMHIFLQADIKVFKNILCAHLLQNLVGLMDSMKVDIAC